MYIYLYSDAVIICCICMFYFSKYGGAINNNNRVQYVYYCPAGLLNHFNPEVFIGKAFCSTIPHAA